MALSVISMILSAAWFIIDLLALETGFVSLASVVVFVAAEAALITLNENRKREFRELEIRVWKLERRQEDR